MYTHSPKRGQREEREGDKELVKGVGEGRRETKGGEKGGGIKSWRNRK